jgi:hypothetical protein
MYHYSPTNHTFELLSCILPHDIVPFAATLYHDGNDNGHDGTGDVLHIIGDAADNRDVGAHYATRWPSRHIPTRNITASFDHTKTNATGTLSAPLSPSPLSTTPLGSSGDVDLLSGDEFDLPSTSTPSLTIIEWYSLDSKMPAGVHYSSVVFDS